jgi:hypothetical protein
MTKIFEQVGMKRVGYDGKVGLLVDSAPLIGRTTSPFFLFFLLKKIQSG